MFDLDDYEHPGCHDVEHGLTGLLNLQQVEEKEIQKLHTRNFEKKFGPVTNNIPEYLKKIQKDYPEILWLGRVPNGLKDAHLHFHVDEKTDTVDSIIIDMEYFFHSEVDLHSEDDDLTGELPEYDLEDSYTSSEDAEK
jgi:hypothetical protein